MKYKVGGAMPDMIPYVNPDEAGRKTAELLLNAAESPRFKKEVILNYAGDRVIPALMAHIEERSGRFEKALLKIGYNANKKEAGLLEQEILKGKLVPALDGLVYNAHPTINSNKTKYLLPPSHKKGALLASVIFLTLSVMGCISNQFASEKEDEPIKKIITEEGPAPGIMGPNPAEINPSSQNPPNADGTAVDSDGDWLPDEIEAFIGTDPLKADTDNDKLTDGEEFYAHRTNPLLADSDGDNFMDWFEVQYKANGWGLNPNAPMTENEFKKIAQIFQVKREPGKGWVMPDSWIQNIDADREKPGIQALDSKSNNQGAGSAEDFLELYTNLLRIYNNQLDLFDSRDDYCVKPFQFLPYCAPEICLPPVTVPPLPYCQFWDIGKQCGQDGNSFSNKIDVDNYVWVWFVDGPVAKPGTVLDLIKMRGHLDFNAMAKGKPYARYLIPDFIPFSSEPIDTQTEVIKYLRFYTNITQNPDLRCFNLVWVSGEAGQLMAWPNPTCLSGGCQPSSNIPPGNPPSAV